GKCVEDELFYFGIQCSKEYQSHSFIIDANSQNLKKNYGIFNDEELDEIKQHNQKLTLKIPVTLGDYLNRFNKNSTTQIRKEVFRPMEFDSNFDPKRHFDYDWIRSSVSEPSFLTKHFLVCQLKIPLVYLFFF
ncbi:hypothetical protein BCV72DRAFT_203838, partial [Rhizopus microsporus var. microsporus]